MKLRKMIWKTNSLISFIHLFYLFHLFIPICSFISFLPFQVFIFFTCIQWSFHPIPFHSFFQFNSYHLLLSLFWIKDTSNILSKDLFSSSTCMDSYHGHSYRPRCIADCHLKVCIISLKQEPTKTLHTIKLTLTKLIFHS